MGTRLTVALRRHAPRPIPSSAAPSVPPRFCCAHTPPQLTHPTIEVGVKKLGCGGGRPGPVSRDLARALGWAAPWSLGGPGEMSASEGFLSAFPPCAGLYTQDWAGAIRLRHRGPCGYADSIARLSEGDGAGARDPQGSETLLSITGKMVMTRGPWVSALVFPELGRADGCRRSFSLSWAARMVRATWARELAGPVSPHNTG